MAELQKHPRNPLRNFTPREAEEILDNPHFQQSKNFTKEEWEKTKRTVRDAIRKMQFNLPIRAGEAEADICIPIGRLAVKIPGMTLLYHRPDVRSIRHKIKSFINVRLKIASAYKFLDLLEIIKRTQGRVTIEDLRRTSPGVFHEVVPVMRKLVEYFGRSSTDKETAVALINEFLSEQTGVPVKIADSLLLRRKKRNVQPEQEELGAESDNDGDDSEYVPEKFFGELPPLDPEQLLRPEDKIQTLEALKRGAGGLAYLPITERVLSFLTIILAKTSMPLTEGSIVAFRVSVNREGAVELRCPDMTRPIILKTDGNVRFLRLAARNPYEPVPEVTKS
ncbi:hypothetical protein HZA42_03970 [Candidatus Peregrinibacteria bacterium]|nr:hypothetical protein [Candidatus Peregrinibacteria bacterium]